MLLFCLNHFLLLIQSKLLSKGSDHSFHLALIENIKKNKNRFLLNYPNVIGGKNFAYPHLLHLLLSYLNKQSILKNEREIGRVLNHLSLFVFVIFSLYVYKTMEPEISLNKFIICSGLLYILTPFSFALWNAKNTGISTRGFGIFLVYVYQFFLLEFYLNNNYIMFFPIIITFVIIILSSQLATQFIVLSTPFLVYVYKDIIFLISLLLSFIIFYLFFPKLAKNYFKGQFWHKTIYFKYLAKISILKNRPSIWLDFFYTIWKELFKDFKKGLYYIYLNPIISILVSIPTFGTLCFYLIIKSDYNFTKLELGLLINLTSALFVFIITSFKKTRFLGEPERYIELSLPSIIAFMLMVTDFHQKYLYLNISISIVLLIGQFLVAHYFLKPSILSRKKMLETIKDLNHANNARVFSNNYNVHNSVLETGAKVLLTNLTCNFTGNFSFNEIYKKDFPMVDKSVLLPLAKEFKINCLVIDNSFYRLESVEGSEHLPIINTFNCDNFTIYQFA